MDNLQTLLTSFNGRISRKTFWFGLLIIAIVGVILGFLLSSVFGVSALDPSKFLDSDGALDMTAFSETVLAQASRVGWFNLIIFIILLFPISALFIKRRHDRGSAGLEYWVYAALSLVMLLLQATGIGYTVVEFGGMVVPTPTLITTVVMFASGAIGIFLIVVCGFLKGNEGSNSFGDDPLGGGE